MKSSMSANGIINITQGDTLSFNFKINLGTKLYPDYYTLKENDNLYLSVCEYNQDFEEGVIRKKYSTEDMSDGIIKIKIINSDTLNLEKGTYYYTIKLRKATGDGFEYITLIDKNIFNVL